MANDCHATQNINSDSHATQINFYDYYTTQNISTPLFGLILPFSFILKLLLLGIITAIMVSINDLFPTIEQAQDIINRYILDEGESYKVYKSDSYYYIIICKEATCKFRIRASLLKKKGAVITVLIIHSCSLTTYYKNK